MCVCVYFLLLFYSFAEPTLLRCASFSSFFLSFSHLFTFFLCMTL